MPQRLAQPALLVACAPWLAGPVAAGLLVRQAGLAPGAAAGPLMGYAVVLLLATVCVGALAFGYRPVAALITLSCLLAVSVLLLSKLGNSVIHPSGDEDAVRELGLGVPGPVRLLIWLPPLLAGFWLLDRPDPAGQAARSRPLRTVCAIWFTFAPTMLAWLGVQYLLGLWAGFLRLGPQRWTLTPRPVGAYLAMSAVTILVLVAGLALATGVWRRQAPAVPALALVAALGLATVLPWVVATLEPRSGCCETYGHWVNQVQDWLDLAGVSPARSMAWFEDVDIDLLAWVPVHALTVALLLVHLARDQRRTTQGRRRPPAVGSTIDPPAAPAPGRREAT